MRLFDDTFMSRFFRDNVPAMDLVLQTILKGDDKIGGLMADFRCTKASEAHFPIIAEGLRYFKEGEGRECAN